MSKQRTPKATLVIAGPGAGKTHNMVNEVIKHLPSLSPCRYLAVITHTNAATNNIKERLAKKINLPPNLFIGTIHSFLNKFIVIPYSSFNDTDIPHEKLFVQFGVGDALAVGQKKENISKDDFQAIAALRNRIVTALKKKGYITFDQTLALAKNSINDAGIATRVANRLQYLFVDEFQDTGNDVYTILETLRKSGKTKIYCVGDPEQYIQSFDSTIKIFTNIPILRAAVSTGYEVQLNQHNYRCCERIVNFLNLFNGRTFGGVVFEQFAKEKNPEHVPNPKPVDPEIYYIKGDGSAVLPAIEKFYKICDDEQIVIGDRCLLAKEDKLVTRIMAAVNNRFRNPKKNGNISPISIIRDTVLYMLWINSEQFYSTYKKSAFDLRKLSVELFHAIRQGIINNENEFGNYLKDKHDLIVKRSMFVKIEDMKFSISTGMDATVTTVSNIHTIKGLESEAVLVFAKSEAELLKWLEIARPNRDADKNDVCRIGYVAFSRAERLLCISCVTNISEDTEKLLTGYGLKIK